MMTALFSCGENEPTRPADRAALILSLSPAEGDLVWAVGSDEWSVELTPPLRWEAQFVAPETTWTLFVVVRLLSRDVACLQSFTHLDTLATKGFPYTAHGDDFRLVLGPQNPCGDHFDVDTAELTLRISSTIAPPVDTLRIPCALRFSRLGR